MTDAHAVTAAEFTGALWQWPIVALGMAMGLCAAVALIVSLFGMAYMFLGLIFTVPGAIRRDRQIKRANSLAEHIEAPKIVPAGTYNRRRPPNMTEQRRKATTVEATYDRQPTRIAIDQPKETNQ